MNPAYQLSIGLGLSFAFLATLGLAQPARPKADDVFFEKKIAPIFKKSCVQCHNPDKATSDLDVMTYATLMTGGSSGEAVMAGSARSKIIGQNSDTPIRAA